MKPNSDRSAARPAGFNRPVQEKKKQPQTEIDPKAKKRKSAQEKAHARAVERARRDELRMQKRVEKAQKRARRTPEQKRRKWLRIGTGILAAILLGLAAIVIFGDHTKTVHQMPMIQRESREEAEGGE